MAAAAETLEAQIEGMNGGGFDAPPEVICVSEMADDELTRRRAERFVRSVGSVAIGEQPEAEQAVRAELPSDESTSLMDSIHRAAWGDRSALRLVHSNAATDVVERTIKAGHVMKVNLDRGSDGRLMQHGQSLETIDANTHRYAAGSRQMAERARAETNNRFRLETAYQQGLLKDYYFVVLSRAADDMSRKELEDSGFFVDTMSCALQATTEDENGQVPVESAFVAGVAEKGEPRHDGQTIVELGRRLGVDYGGMSATQILDSPLLVHKSLMPNGVIDLVRLYDESAGGTFFGQDKRPQDYLAYRRFCRERERQFEPIVQEIVEQLVSEADSIHTPIDAVRRLHELSQQRTLRYAIQKDTSIDARVFGEEAAEYIEQARIHYAMGNHELSMAAERKAQRVAKSSSCPSAIKDKSTKALENDATPDGLNMPDERESDESNKESDNGKIRCISCRKKVPKKLVVKKDCWECPRCNHKVDICSGEVLRQGRTASSAMESIGNTIFANFGNPEEVTEAA